MAKKVKNLKYVLRYTIPNKLGANNIFMNFVTIKCTSAFQPSPKDIFDHLIRTIISNTKESNDIEVVQSDIDITMISLVDTTFE